MTDELDKIDREAIRCGRGKYIVLGETEEDASAGCILERLWACYRTEDPTSLWSQDPKCKVKQLSRPLYLNERLDAINTGLGYHSDKAEKL